MGMAIGNHLDIREVTSEDFHIMAERIGINMRLIRNMVKEFQQQATAALNAEGNLLSEQGFKSAPYIADELREEMLPRLEVLSKIW